MPFNVMIQLCKITRASRLFQRNFYLPLLKPLSPKDALRRRIITGKDVLAKQLEHYIPVLEEYATRVARRRYLPKGRGKKRQRKKASMRYVTPFFDENMDGHTRLQGTVERKPKGKGQCYTYYVPEKNCTLVLSHQFERAIRDKDVVDILMAQRHEKILVKLKDGRKVVLPLVTYDGHAPFYRGEGWTRKEVEEHHHHGKDTFTLAQLFEAKEQGVEEWELEMMRMANKRKKKMRGEGTLDWKQMMAATAENMDWEEFEEETKQIVAEANEPVEDAPIPMELDGLEKTRNVNEKLLAAGADVLEMLPVMPEIPEIIGAIKDTHEVTDVANVSGVRVALPSSGDLRFVPGQIVRSEDGELFVPGQTVAGAGGAEEYTPGFTVMLDGEPTLIPGLVMGNDPEKAMFLPGESTITRSGELQFAENEDDVVLGRETPLPDEPDEPDEPELEEEQSSEDEPIEQRPPPRRPPQEFSYERPKRQFAAAPMSPKRRERGPKRAAPAAPAAAPAGAEATRRPAAPAERVLYDLTVPTFEKDLLEQEKERLDQLKEKTGKEEAKVDKKRREIRNRAKELLANAKVKPKYVPLDPVNKSEKLKEYEQSIKKGDFFSLDYKKYLVRERNDYCNWLEAPEYARVFDTVGIARHRLWRNVA